MNVIRNTWLPHKLFILLPTVVVPLFLIVLSIFGSVGHINFLLLLLMMGVSMGTYGGFYFLFDGRFDFMLTGILTHWIAMLFMIQPLWSPEVIPDPGRITMMFIGLAGCYLGLAVKLAIQKLIVSKFPTFTETPTETSTP